MIECFHTDLRISPEPFVYGKYMAYGPEEIRKL